MSTELIVILAAVFTAIAGAFIAISGSGPSVTTIETRRDDAGTGE